VTPHRDINVVFAIVIRIRNARGSIRSASAVFLVFYGAESRFAQSEYVHYGVFTEPRGPWFHNPVSTTQLLASGKTVNISDSRLSAGDQD
jgi:hypothetical protein